ncbi:glycosyltransferase family protein [Pollutimonas sp. M17]|uniref:glycosyltransferase family protein n=1 Tax=Pollutimonas sp. M17 TaxID=2962065 RepID=UPI0021F45E48|nr:glycosyltransferase family protein [Pollutimonas sp. M17]UYO93976.1 glycosyltransferase family protein [Pollutimonas sp. M17]
MMATSKPKVVATIEARMTSSRLPGKVLLPAAGEPMLMHLVKRLRAVESIDAIVIATTTNDSDEPIVEFAKATGVLCHRGSEDDVLARVIGAGDMVQADVLVEITGDCPVIDPDLVEQTIRMFFHHDVQYVANSLIRSYPDGMDTQVMGLSALKLSATMTNDRLDREHVSRFICQHPEMFSHLHLIAPPSLHWPELGLTLDEERDYQLLKKIIEELAPVNPLFGCGDMIRLLRARPEWVNINRQVLRKGDS